MGVASIAVPAIDRCHSTETVRGNERQTVSTGHGPCTDRIALVVGTASPKTTRSS